MKKPLALAVLTSFFFLGCATSKKEEAAVPGPRATSAESARVTAGVKDAKGKPLGTIEFTQVEGGVRVVGELSGVPPGRHGFHLHQNHECKGPDFKTAGDHFNPNNQKHGRDNPAGSHAGDLPNIVADKKGRSKIDVHLRNVSLAADSSPNSLFSGMGTTLVVHAKPDDQKTDPSGGSGDRIACGLIRKE